MSRRLISIFFAGCMLCWSNAFAFQAEHFRGWYEILGSSNKLQSFVLVDVDTLGNIWAKYSDGDLPEDLEQYREEPTIISGFTNREFVMVSFEAFAMITERYLRMSGDDGLLYELYRQDNGTYALGIRENGNVSRYLLAAPTPISDDGLSERQRQINLFLSPQTAL